MSYSQKCKISNENPVLDAHHFQYRVEVFFTEILVGSDPLGEIKYYAVVFQCHGSPHTLHKNEVFH